jgi:flagellar motor switch protein FliN/FliY
VPVDRLAGVPAGTIIDLDRDADEPVDLYVNGRRFALGRLELADGQWAVRLERLLPQDSPELDPSKGR